MDVEIFIFFLVGYLEFFLKKHKGAYAQKYTTSAGWGGGRVGRGQGGRGSENETEVSAHACVCVLILGIGEWCLSPSYICVVKWHTIIPQSLRAMDCFGNSPSQNKRRRPEGSCKGRV